MMSQRKYTIESTEKSLTNDYVYIVNMLNSDTRLQVLWLV